MKAATERKIVHWIYILISLPVIGLIYAPAASFLHTLLSVKWVIFPLIALFGLWLLKGHSIRKKLKRDSYYGFYALAE